MSYSVEHVRYTLECDACGRVEKRDLDRESDAGTAGWGSVVTRSRTGFCCPECLSKVNAILDKKEVEKSEAQKKLVDDCEHDYQPRGLLMQCVKCQRFR
jgi:Zn finger protein HypA/HybF involved in hydrogenase expression